MKVYLLTSSHADEDGDEPDETGHEEVHSPRSVFTTVAGAMAEGTAEYRELTEDVAGELKWSAVGEPSSGAHGGIVCTASDDVNGIFWYVRELEVYDDH